MCSHPDDVIFRECLVYFSKTILNQKRRPRTVEQLCPTPIKTPTAVLSSQTVTGCRCTVGNMVQFFVSQSFPTFVELGSTRVTRKSETDTTCSKDSCTTMRGG